MENKRKRGRPPGKITPVQINVYVSKADVVTIDGARGDKSRSSFMRKAAVDASQGVSKWHTRQQTDQE